MFGTESMIYNVWTDPISLIFYGFCAVFLMGNVKPLLEMFLKDWKDLIQKKSKKNYSKPNIKS